MRGAVACLAAIGVLAAAVSCGGGEDRNVTLGDSSGGGASIPDSGGPDGSPGSGGEDTSAGGRSGGGGTRAGTGGDGSGDAVGAGGDTVGAGGVPAEDAGAGGSRGGSGGAPPAGECEHSRDCAGDTWCNPATHTCDSRTADTPSFSDVLSILSSHGCTACHAPGGPGAVDNTASGEPLVFAGYAINVYQGLVAGGVTCGSAAHRLCVDDPATAVLARQALALPGAEHIVPFSAFDSWAEADLQTILRWMAAGAPRTTTKAFCGDHIVGDGEECDEGLFPPRACPYGVPSCTLCGGDCKEQTVVGSYCGDGLVDENAETCDDGNPVTEEVREINTAKPTCGTTCTTVETPTCGLTYPEMSCCTASSPPCNAGAICNPATDTCISCGWSGQPCCDEGDACRAGSQCNTGTGKCEACGYAGLPCCEGVATPCTLSECNPQTKQCDACGGRDEPCCSDDACFGDQWGASYVTLECQSGTCKLSEPCGDYMLPCCPVIRDTDTQCEGEFSYPSAYCRSSSSTCELCYEGYGCF